MTCHQHHRGYQSQEHDDAPSPLEQDEAQNTADEEEEGELAWDLYSFLLEVLDWGGEHQAAFCFLLLLCLLFGQLVVVPIVQALANVLIHVLGSPL